MQPTYGNLPMYKIPRNYPTIRFPLSNRSYLYWLSKGQTKNKAQLKCWFTLTATPHLLQSLYPHLSIQPWLCLPLLPASVRHLPHPAMPVGLPALSPYTRLEGRCSVIHCFRSPKSGQNCATIQCLIKHS